MNRSEDPWLRDLVGCPAVLFRGVVSPNLSLAVPIPFPRRIEESEANFLYCLDDLGRSMHGGP